MTSSSIASPMLFHAHSTALRMASNGLSAAGRRRSSERKRDSTISWTAKAVSSLLAK